MDGPADLTVIIPVGTHHAAYVGEAVASCFQGTMRPTEVIVVNDDAEPQVQPSQIRGATLLLPDRKVGRAEARNIGVSKATTNWLYFLDADDMLYPDAIRRFHKLSQAKPDVHLFYAEYVWTDVNTGQTKRCKQNPFKRSSLARFNLAHIGLFVLRERFWLVGGFDRGMEFAEDRDFFIRYVINPKINVFKADAPFLHTRRGIHSRGDAPERYGDGMKVVDGRFAKRYYDRWRSV